jgi:hypothetical protein
MIHGEIAVLTCVMLRKNAKLIKVDVEVWAVYTGNKRLTELRYEMDIIKFNLLL